MPDAVCPFLSYSRISLTGLHEKLMCPLSVSVVKHSGNNKLSRLISYRIPQNLKYVSTHYKSRREERKHVVAPILILP